MKSRFALGAIAALLSLNAAAAELRVATHESFSLSKELIADFEKQSGVKLVIIKAGDTGELVNKLILTRAKPIADMVYGVDNTLVAKAVKAGIVEPYNGPAAKAPTRASLPGGVVAVDYGYVTLNYDKAWFAKRKLALPKSLDDLTRPEYKDLLLVQNPATSSPGYAFLAATIAGMGEEGAFAWWGKMRQNGVKVTKGWSDAYYTDFSKSGGARPLVVSYATSPASEVFYAKEKLSESPTGNLFLKGGVFRQVEGAALLKGGAEREAAGRFIEFLRSPAVQKDLQTRMWMYPADSRTAPAPELAHAAEPASFDNPSPEVLDAKGAAWVARWTRVVLK